MNTDTVMNNSAENTTILSVAVKVSRGDEMRRFNFKGQSFTELKNIIAELFSVPADDFSLQYQDDEKDRVTLSSDAELKEAIQLHKYVLRFFVILTKANVGELPLPYVMPMMPHHPHHHHRHIHHQGVPPPPPPHVMAAVPGGEAGEAAVPPPPFGHHHHHGHGGRHGGRHGYGPYGRPHGHGAHKRFLKEEEKEAIKCEKRRWKKQRKCESSSSSCSSSSEDEAQKAQRKEMRQLMKATKESIKANWAVTKQANPAQWPENRKVMIAEIKLAKRMIREQAKKSPSPSVAVTEQNAPVVTAAAEMQA